MQPIHIKLALFTAVVTGSAALPRSGDAQNASILHWRKCSGLPGYQCSYLTVPLDYHNQSSGMFQLPLIKLPASKPSKGAIITNFGGPGESGITSLPAFGPDMTGVIGGDYDLISWTPRGVDDLAISCFANDTEGAAVSSLLQFPNGKASDVAWGQNWVSSQILANQCAINAAQNGSFVGTVATSRDVMGIVDALGGDKLLRYWGISYGTALGATIAAMFPDRIDKMLLDGVVNPWKYWGELALIDTSNDDKALEGFCTNCVASGPDLCPLGMNRTAIDVCKLIYDGLETLKYNPVYGQASTGPVLVEYNLIKNYIVTELYAPYAWNVAAGYLDELFRGNLTRIVDYISAASQDASSNAATTEWSIRCSDTPIRYDTLGCTVPSIEASDTSRLGAGFDTPTITKCANWPFNAVERYTGGFKKISTRNPLFFIGNTFDPVTPFAGAQNASAGFVGSGLLERRVYGHSTLTYANLCTSRAIRAYFSSGVLPAAGTVCEPDMPFFVDDGGAASWDAVIKALDS